MTTPGESTTDEIGARLAAFWGELQETLEGSARFEQEALGQATFVLTPTKRDAVGVAWTDWGDALHLEVLGGQGGRWELGRGPADADFLVAVVRSVVAGRVVETFGERRSRVEVTLADGTVETEIGHGPGGCLPQPFWLRRGRRQIYSPYL